MARKGFELIPSARRLITSLRDMGYDFAAAVADVIDNSIEARATRVAVDVEFDGDDSSVRIADNGTGMNPAQIREALRYGADRDYETESLGKFGLGLKTASMSQCQRLTVASRSSAERADIYAHSWDLDHVAATDRWEIIEVPRREQTDTLREPLLDGPGTVVLWQRLDRILGFKHPYGENAKKRLSAMCRELEAHLGMVFNRYMTGEAAGRKVRFTLNGNPIKPWDPFARAEPATQQLEPITLHYDHDAIAGDILIQPFVLPHQDDFSSPQGHADTAGPQRWNRQQGFYIYRANRMIQSGGWCNLRTLDEHTKLARIAVSFNPVLDEAFRINVAKMKVQLPQQLRDQFEKAIGPVIKIAQGAYRRPVRNSAIPASPSPPSRSSSLITPSLPPKPAADIRTERSPDAGVPSMARASQIDHSTLTSAAARLWTMEQLRREADRVATADERPVVAAVFARLNSEFGDD
jgi:hypothetical protein